MKEIKETAVSYCVGDSYVSVYTSENKYCNKIKSYKEKYPEEIDIIAENDDGSMLAEFPIKWFKFPRHPKKMSDEQKEAAGERMKKMWKNKQ